MIEAIDVWTKLISQEVEERLAASPLGNDPRLHFAITPEAGYSRGKVVRPVFAEDTHDDTRREMLSLRGGERPADAHHHMKESLAIKEVKHGVTL